MLEVALCYMNKVKLLEVQIIPVLKGDDKQDHKTHVKQETWLSESSPIGREQVKGICSWKRIFNRPGVAGAVL